MAGKEASKRRAKNRKLFHQSCPARARGPRGVTWSNTMALEKKNKKLIKQKNLNGEEGETEGEEIKSSLADTKTSRRTRKSKNNFSIFNFKLLLRWKKPGRAWWGGEGREKGNQRQQGQIRTSFNEGVRASRLQITRHKTSECFIKKRTEAVRRAEGSGAGEGEQQRGKKLSEPDMKGHKL